MTIPTTPTTPTSPTTSRTPKTMLLAACATALACACAPACASGQSGLLTTTSRLVGSQLELRDASTDRALLATHGVSMLDRFPVGVTSRIEHRAQPGGADVVFTFKNVTQSPKKLGRIRLGIFNLGSDIEYLNFRNNANAERGHTSDFVGQAWQYPDDMYSPVTVLRNQQVALGVSIQYPILEYKHDVRVELASPGNWMEQGEAGRGWLLDFGLANVGEEHPSTRMEHEGQLAPGEERTYTISVRATSNVHQWQSTLLPYRDYFRATYGGVQYLRKTEPVAGMSLAELSNQNASNPLAFRYDMRPDVNGFGPVKNAILAQPGWSSWMLWTVSGLYNTHKHRNYPYQAGTNLLSTPMLATAFDEQQGLPAVRAAGKDVGIWWGRSVQLATAWDTDELIPFDPDNAEHVRIALREIDTIAQTGVNMVGLDTFSANVTPLWKLAPWLRTLQERYPNIRYVTEPSSCDVLHAMTPTFVWGNRYSEITSTNHEDFFELKRPNELADFLLPGHETWASFGYKPDYVRQMGAPSRERIIADIRKYAELGYRPIFWTQTPIPSDIRAASSWEFTVPGEIREADPQIQNVRAGRRPTEDQVAPPPIAPVVPPTTPTEPTTPTTPTTPNAPAAPPAPVIIAPPSSANSGSGAAPGGSNTANNRTRLRGADRRTNVIVVAPPARTTTTTTTRASTPAPNRAAAAPRSSSPTQPTTTSRRTTRSTKRTTTGGLALTPQE